VSLFVSQNKYFCFTDKYDLEEYQNMIDESEAFVFLVVKQFENYHEEMTFANP
jgi:histidinol phosphatase-like PHP family hydrolase